MDANAQKAAEAQAHADTTNIAAPPPTYHNAPNQFVDTADYNYMQQEHQQAIAVRGSGLSALRKLYGRIFMLTLIRCAMGVAVVALGAVVLTQKPAHDAKAIAASIVAFGALNIPFVVKPRPRSPDDARLPGWYVWVNVFYTLGWLAMVGVALNQTINGDNDPVVDKPPTTSSGYSYDDGYSWHWKRRGVYIGYGGGWDFLRTTIQKMFLASGIIAIVGA